MFMVLDIPNIPRHTPPPPISLYTRDMLTIRAILGGGGGGFRAVRRPNPSAQNVKKTHFLAHFLSAKSRTSLINIFCEAENLRSM